MPSLKLGDTALIIAECKKRGLLRAQCAYVLATAHHETGGTMKPVRETFAATDAQAKARLTKAWKASKLPGVKRDYWSGGYYGRGYPQTTHVENYRWASDVTGVDLVKNPDRMMEPAIAVQVMLVGMIEGRFREGHTLARYINAAKADFYGARDIINGDKRRNGKRIADLAAEYDLALKIAKYDATPAKPVEPTKAETPVKDMAMSLGDSGPLVEELQCNLNTLGMSVAVTGKFDEATETSVMAFQSLHKDEDGNPLKVDGKVGHRTSKAIERALLKPKIEEAKKTVPPAADKAVKEKSNFWTWVMGLFGAGSGGLSAAFSSDWQTVLAVGGVVIVALIVILLMRSRILAAFDDINARAAK